MSLLLRALRNNVAGALALVGLYVANSMLFGYVVPAQFEGYSFLGFNALCALVIGSWVAVTVWRENH